MTSPLVAQGAVDGGQARVTGVRHQSGVILHPGARAGVREVETREMLTKKHGHSASAKANAACGSVPGVPSLKVSCGLNRWTNLSRLCYGICAIPHFRESAVN